MKTIFSVFTFLILILQTNLLTAQWQPDVRLTNNPAESYSYGQSVGASGPFVYALWTDGRTGDYEIFFKRSGNEGSSWYADMQLTISAGISDEPVLAVSGPYLHVVWLDGRYGDYGIFYKRAPTYGGTWEADRRLSSAPGSSESPAVAASGANVYAVWMDLRNYKWDIFYKKSQDNGLNWGAETKLSLGAGWSMAPTIAAAGSAVSVAWVDNRDGNKEIYYLRSTNGGVSWSTETRMTNNAAVSTSPSITAVASYVHLVWIDERDGNKEVYYQRSLNGGSSWATAVRLTNNSADAWTPRVSSSGALVHIVWDDTRYNNEEIFYKLSTNYGQTWGTDTRLTFYSDVSANPSVTTIGAFLHIVWCDKRDGNFEIYYKQNPTGNAIGIKNISTEIPKEFSLSQNYPNPFNPSTKIRFSLPSVGQRHAFDVHLIIYDILGREVATLVNEQLQPGTYEVEFSANGGGSGLTSGVYFYKLSTDSYNESKRMVLLK